MDVPNKEPAATNLVSPPVEAKSDESPSSTTSPYVWYVVGLLGVVNIFNYMDRSALPMLAPAIKADFHLSDAQLGLLVGFAFSLFYAICAIPIARLADRHNRRNIIAIAVAVWSIMTALSGAAQNFWHLFLARVGVGAGEAGGLAPAQSIICDYVPLRQRPAAFALHSLGLTIGSAIGIALAGWLAELIGWRWTFVALGLPGVALALIVRFSLREPLRGFFDAAKDHESGRSLVASLKFLWRRKTYRHLLLVGVALGFIGGGQGAWFPSFYERVHDLSLSSLGVSLALVGLVGGAIGLLAGGFVSSYATQRDIRLPLLIGATATFVGAPAAIAALLVNSATISLVLGGVASVCLAVAVAPVTATVYSVVPPNMRATAGTILYFFSTALGAGLGPVCVGFLSDMLTPQFGAEALRYAMFAPLALQPVMIVALWLAAHTLSNDLRDIGAK